MSDKARVCPYPRAAVAVIVSLDNRVLVGKRRIHADKFEWQLPGGWIINGETPEDAARREVEEETGLSLGEVHLVAVTNNVFSPQNHSISLCFEAECANPDQLRIKEPEKCLGWHWRIWQDLNENLFLPLAVLKKSDYRPLIQDKRNIDIVF